MLEKDITRLAKAIRDAVTKYKAQSTVPTRRYVHVRRRDFSLKYHEDFGFGQFAPQRLEEDVWDWNDQQRFGESVIKSLEEYRSLVSTLGPNPSLMESLVRALSSASFRGLDDRELGERASALALELAGTPLPVTVTAFIDGLSISESPVVISKSLLLRRPTEEDVAEFVAVDEHGSHSFSVQEAWFRTIGEYVFDAVSTGAAQMEFLRVVEALRLYRVGGIAANRFTMRSRHSFLQGGAATLSSPSRHSKFSYTLSGADGAALKRFLDDVVPLLPDPFEGDKSMTPSGIALTRYLDALFQNGPPEQTITSAITALEALFLDDRIELAHRLAQRVCIFLRLLGTQPDAQQAYDDIKKGYAIRSKFVHGGSLRTQDRPQAASFAPVLVDYARTCLLAFFQMTVPKGELLEQLDRTMIDPKSAIKLESSLALIAHK